jgi:hypothetical protein
VQRKLTDAKIKNLKPRNKGYKSADGGGLYMFTNPKGAKSFRYDFKHHCLTSAPMAPINRI